MPSRVQRIEVGNAVDPEHQGLAIDDVLPDAVLQRGFDDPRIAVGPVITVARDQPHPLVFADNDETVAVVFNLV